MRRRLPNIRSRILASFLTFGLAICALVMVSLAVATDASTALLILALLLLLVLLSGWHIATYVSRDVRHLSHTFDQVEFEELPRALDELRRHVATAEVDELSQSIRAFAARVRVRAGRVDNRLSAARAQIETAGETLSNFMYYIAHVLRTPINEIRWSVETLKNEEVGVINGEQREMLDRLERSSVSLALLASDLQDTLIVMRGDRLRAHPVQSDLVGLLEEAAGRWAVPARRRSLRLRFERPKSPLPEVPADPLRLRRVLDALLENAIRYTREGGSITLSVEAVRHGSDGSRRLQAPRALPAGTVVTVSDDGIGIPAAEQSSLFQPFFRGSNARDLWTDGRGIGLALSAAIVREHGGEIWIRSRERHGTTARFFLPSSRA